LTREMNKKILVRLTTVCVAIAAWEIITRLGIMDSAILPPPSQCARAAKRLLSILFEWAAVSLARVSLGLLIAGFAGVGLGLMMGRRAYLHKILDPIVEVLRPIPSIAWIPLIILWIGIGNLGAITIIVIGAFFPILLNTIAGVRSIDHTLIDLMRTLGAKEKNIFWEIIVPGSLPFIFGGFRVSIGIGWASVVAAEMFGAQSGLGYLIQWEANFLHTAEVVVGMACIGLIGYLLDYSFCRYVVSRWLAWKET